EPYDIRTDRLPGESDTLKAGLVRAFDGKPDEPTYIFMRGNEKNPLKDEWIPPAFPGLLSNTSCSMEPVQLPQSVWYPGSVAFVREDILSAARGEVEKANAALAAAKSKFEQVVEKAG